MSTNSEIKDLVFYIDEVIEKIGFELLSPCIAISGGADSVFLTFLLSELKIKRNFILLHFDHGWRKEDLVFERDLIANCAERYNFKVIFGASKVPEKKDEDEARKNRFNFFSNTMNKIGSNILFTGHNLNDRFETFLWNICRGTGLSGMLSPKEVRKNKNFVIFSPLIHVRREKIRVFCEYLGLRYTSDPYNEDISYKRVFIRKEITPKIENIWSNSLEHFDTFIKLAEDESKYFDKVTDEIYSNVILKLPWANIIYIKELFKFDIALIRRVIIKFLNSLNISYGFKEIELLYRYLSNNSHISLSSFKDMGIYRNENIFSIYDLRFLKGYTDDSIPEDLGIIISKPLETKIDLQIRYFRSSDYLVSNGKKIYLYSFFNKKNQYFYKFVPMIFYKNTLRWSPFAYFDENFFKSYNIEIVYDRFLEKLKLTWRQDDRNYN
jgi:tRNA(Ile)-lysidine synthase